MTGDSQVCNKVLVSIVAADGRVLKHQAIGSFCADSIPIVLASMIEMVTLNDHI